jgi:predicted component of type VI protein secretion system
MRLVIEDETGTRSIVPFVGEAIVVGRANEDVTFRLSDRNVSRRHARFVCQAGAVFVEDLGSLTGTRVNGERINGRRRLRDGDLVQIGEYDLAVLGAEAAAGPDAPPPLPASPRDPDETPAPVPPVAGAPAVVVLAPPRRGRTLRIAVLAGALALAVGIAAGLATGALPGSSSPTVTRP